MDPAKVLMLAQSVGLYPLTPELKARIWNEEFWQNLERTPESELTKDQLEVISALGVNLGSEDDEDDEDGEDAEDP